MIFVPNISHDVPSDAPSLCNGRNILAPSQTIQLTQMWKNSKLDRTFFTKLDISLDVHLSSPLTGNVHFCYHELFTQLHIVLLFLLPRGWFKFQRPAEDIESSQGNMIDC